MLGQAGGGCRLCDEGEIPEEAAKRPRSARRIGWWVAVGLLSTSLVAPVVVPEAAPPAKAADPPEMCQSWAAGWVSFEVPCEDQRPLPRWARKFFIGSAGAAIAAVAFGGPAAVPPAVAGAAVGCINP